MAYNKQLAERIRQALSHRTDVEEKAMFGGMAFMVDGKMCVTAGEDRIMCRIDPAAHEEALQKAGTETVVMRGRDYLGYVYVHEDAVKSREDLDYWIGMALAFNKVARASVKKPKSKK